ncbi:prephenate dehydratase [Methanothermococcus okinawensis]|uniref:prephenate dehydratase n=1 Tax=Methanothermococcus okinawensis (strain DSM 14208 / JCM 11175 / IH1) TaxID=647113 RepID=F8AKG2_METOI|nr:prephenate dehydratase [Methanothermococcus okinawensis]AEH07488.1 Prephenate dehydratase [Methanothermococcus okinawensis IH1]
MIYCLGPKGSYSGQAAAIFSKLINDKDIIYCNSIYEVFELVDRKKGSDNIYGVVPSENSIEGSVSLTQDLLLEFPVKIYGEVNIDIHHCLIGYDKNKIKKVLSHPQALAQCRNYIKKHGWEAIPVLSTAKAVEKVFEWKNEEYGAIASKESAELYNLKVLDEDIQDYPNNTTRFILIGNEHESLECKNTQIDNYKNINNNYQKYQNNKKSTIIIELKENKPGALYKVLKEFNNRSINLTRIESRPSKRKLGNYIFYIDYETPKDEDELLQSLKKHVSYIKYLGSYNVF